MEHLTVILLCVSFIMGYSFENINPPSFKKLGPRIINGDPAQKGQFPWQTALYVSRPGGNTWCGGALISDRWIVTAGHCVQGATNFQIALGSNDLIGQDSNRVVLNTTQYILHESYNSFNLANDIAVIQLPQRVTFNENIRSIALASTNLFSGSTVTVSGWGLTSDSEDGPSPVLNYANLVIISDTECSKVYGKLNEGVVCAHGGFLAQSTCEGDSGGPLVSYNSDGVYHVGVVSFGHPDGCEGGKPSAFTRTDYHRNWIRARTGV